MLKHWDNEVKKKYLIGAVILFVVTFLISIALVFAFSKYGTNGFSVNQKILISLLCAVIPTGSYTGFCLMFIGKEKLTHKQCVLLVVFCLPIVLYACIYGTVMLIPAIITCLVK